MKPTDERERAFEKFAEDVCLSKREIPRQEHKDTFEDGWDAALQSDAVKGLIQSLEAITKHYQHPQHDHNWAHHANWIAETALEKWKGDHETNG